VCCLGQGAVCLGGLLLSQTTSSSSNGASRPCKLANKCCYWQAQHVLALLLQRPLQSNAKACNSTHLLDICKAWHVTFAAVLCSACCCCCCRDVAVSPAWQRSGLGRAMIERLTHQLVQDGISTITLYAEPQVRQPCAAHTNIQMSFQALYTCFVSASLHICSPCLLSPHKLCCAVAVGGRVVRSWAL
jgi:GNAT superfamily N-acetyltransferase